MLTTVRQVRELTPEEDSLGYPVRLRGVVTFHEPDWYLSFVQDATGGIYIMQFDSTLRAGAEIEVEGVSARGASLPIVVGRGGDAAVE